MTPSDLEAIQTILKVVFKIISVFCFLGFLFKWREKNISNQYIPTSQVIAPLVVSIIFGSFFAFTSVTSQSLIGVSSPFSAMPINDALARMSFKMPNQNSLNISEIHLKRIYLFLYFAGTISFAYSILLLGRKYRIPNNHITNSKVLTHLISGIILMNLLEVQCILARFLGYHQLCLI